jgi:hypothetical protein|tara:strand:- start:7113 stop:7550 length:438 start_codon:yes stop_codon:yes gene_type:complete
MAESIREQIAVDLVSTLKQIEEPKPRYVTREPIKISELSQAQMPALLIRTAGEDRSDQTMTGSNMTRLSTIKFEIVGYTKAKPVDTAINQMVEAIEEELDKDRTRNSTALNTQVVLIENDNETLQPFGSFRMEVDVLYKFTRGAL